eukprot:46791-Pelagomonas_calceolata.AAC.3
MCAQFQHLFSSAPPSRATCLREFMNQANVLGLAKHISASAELTPQAVGAGVTSVVPGPLLIVYPPLLCIQ